MFTTPFVFTEKADLNNVGDWGWYFFLPKHIGWFTDKVLGNGAERFISWPAATYLNGSVIFLVLVVLESVFQLFRMMLDANCCCLRKFIDIEISHSHDLFDDLQPDCLKTEYENTIQTYTDFENFEKNTEGLSQEDCDVL